MATPANPRVYMADDFGSFYGSLVSFANFYAWDGHGGIIPGIGRANGDATRGFGFAGEPSSGNVGWAIIDLDTLVAITSPTCGVAFGADMHGLISAITLCRLSETGTGPTHIIIGTDSSNHITARNGDGTLLGTSEYILPATGGAGEGPLYHIEIIVTVHGSAGIVKVRVDDVLVLNLTGKNTRNGGFGTIGYVSLHAEGNRRFAEPAYHDGNGFLGMQWRALTIPVGSVGTYTSGTAFPSGTKLEAVNDAPEDGEAESANYAVLDDTGLAKKLSFVSGAMPALALAIRDVWAQAIIQKSDGGVNSSSLGLKSGSTECYYTSPLAVPDGWVPRRLGFRTNPDTGTPLWTLVTAAAVEVIERRET